MVDLESLSSCYTVFFFGWFSGVTACSRGRKMTVNPSFSFPLSSFFSPSWKFFYLISWQGRIFLLTFFSFSDAAIIEKRSKRRTGELHVSFLLTRHTKEINRETGKRVTGRKEKEGEELDSHPLPSEKQRNMQRIPLPGVSTCPLERFHKLPVTRMKAWTSEKQVNRWTSLFFRSILLVHLLTSHGTGILMEFLQ